VKLPGLHVFLVLSHINAASGDKYLGFKIRTTHINKHKIQTTKQSTL